MLISHSKEFIFIHVPKTGGTSVSWSLQACAADPLNSRGVQLLDRLGIHVNYFGPIPWKRFRKHTPARVVRRHLPGDMFNRYFKFAFVRNPWESLVSLYEFVRKRPDHHRHRRVVAMDFTEFVDYTLARSKSHQHPLVTDRNGRLLIDYLGRYETLPEDFEQICARIGVESQLRHINQTKRRDFRDYYDAASRARVGDYFRRDIELLGYTFD